LPHICAIHSVDADDLIDLQEGEFYFVEKNGKAYFGDKFYPKLSSRSVFDRMMGSKGLKKNEEEIATKLLYQGLEANLNCLWCIETSKAIE
jgi:hypothetical protein